MLKHRQSKPHPQSFWFSGLAMGHRICISDKFPCDLILLVLRDHTLVTAALQWREKRTKGKKGICITATKCLWCTRFMISWIYSIWKSIPFLFRESFGGLSLEFVTCTALVCRWWFHLFRPSFFEQNWAFFLNCLKYS